MKDWNNIQAQTSQDKAPQSAAPRIPTISREIILMLFVGVMAVLGLRNHHRRAQREGYWRIYAYAAELRRKYQAQEHHRVMIEAWVEDPRLHWRRRVRARWLSSRDINNSPDPNIRRIGFDEWFTRRPYSRVPGLGFTRLRSPKNNPHPDRAAGRASRRPGTRRMAAALQGEGVLVFAPP